MKRTLILEIILFIFLIILLLFLGAKIFKRTFDIGTTYHVSFSDIDGIVIGSPVRILGVDVGHVTKIKTAYDEIFVDFAITDSKVKLPQGTQATIEFFGLAGSRSIELTPPNGQIQGQGIIVKPPIRIGDAFDIMGEFLKATMVSIGGLYEFAKDKTLTEVERQTAALVKGTIEADDRVVELTSVIEKGGANVHKSFVGTTKGMTRVYNETTALNPSENVNTARFAINALKRTLIKMHRAVKGFNINAEQISIVASEANIKVVEGYNQIQNMDFLYNALSDLDKAMIEFEKNLTQENLDKIYNLLDDIQVTTQKIECEL